MKATLSKTATGQHKSKIIDPLLCQLVLDVYLPPEDFAQIIRHYDSESFDIVIIDKRSQKE